MKVKCSNIEDKATGKLVKNSSWLTIGKEYVVLSVFIATNKAIEYRISSDDNDTPALFNENQFYVTDNSLSFSWVVNVVSDSYFELAPGLWIREGFWEEYFDGAPQAVEQFNFEKEKILSEYIISSNN